MAILANRLAHGNWTTALWTGVAGGADNFVYYAIAYGITNSLIPR